MRWLARCRCLHPEPSISASEPDPASCSLRSRQLSEEIAGTAPVGLRYVLLLEHPRPWKRECVDSLEGEVAARVRTLVDAREDARLQLIHQPGECPDPPRLMLARVDGASSALWDVPYDALLDSSVAHLEDLADRGVLCSAPVYLVCVHGRRDICCATRGVAFDRALRRRLGVRVFQTSHIGGHRFAATAVVYPQGFYYGRLDDSDARALAEAHERGRVGPTDKLRGRAGMEAIAQAAEAFAMRQVGTSAPQELALARTGSVEFTLTSDSGTHSFEVLRRPLKDDSPKGCDDEPARLSEFAQIPVT